VVDRRRSKRSSTACRWETAPRGRADRPSPTPSDAPEHQPPRPPRGFESPARARMARPLGSVEHPRSQRGIVSWSIWVRRDVNQARRDSIRRRL
jgi:hypothetical protein